MEDDVALLPALLETFRFLEVSLDLSTEVKPKTKFSIEYDLRLITFRQLLEVLWSSHDSRQVSGQGLDVGNQYRSIIFTNGTENSRLAAISKGRHQTRSKSRIIITQEKRAN
ncbi:hypothetical protein RJ639_003372 [Escallonia herrerae]|uniref:peptide-methionine (S)-S-oxide reductase n=1 Tax=Escallonia herrerae TaxID=1293975 RepID=A0AA88W2E0_9ASTE|nr:hypothetical protein RJ639_003372 [Escallonia herrerae]